MIHFLNISNEQKTIMNISMTTRVRNDEGILSFINPALTVYLVFRRNSIKEFPFIEGFHCWQKKVNWKSKWLSFLSFYSFPTIYCSALNLNLKVVDIKDAGKKSLRQSYNRNVQDSTFFSQMIVEWAPFIFSDFKIFKISLHLSGPTAAIND